MNTYIVNGKPYEVSLDQEEQFLKDVEEQGFTATLQQPMEVDQPQINQQQEKPLINLLKTSLKLTPLKPLVDIAEIPVVKNKMLRAGEGAISMVDNFIKGYIGHKDIKTTKMIYGNHTDLNSGSSQDKKIQKALDKAIPISLESDYGY